MIGPATNMARLLATKPDEYSSLSGVELFARKVKLVSAMAADFSEEVQKNPTMENREFNIHVDIPSAEFFFTHCPVEVVFSGYEVGCKILYPAESILQDYQWTDHHPVADAYQVYAKMPYNRPCWDLTSVLYAVHPDKDYFGLSKRGWACVEKTGIVRFREDPEGLHRYLTVTDGQAETLVALFSQLCSCQHPDRIKHKKIADTILSIKSDKPSQVKTSSTDNF
jgi:inosine-uridine nucleoside N-ribohydrolase